MHLSVSDGGSGVGSVLYSTDGTEPYLAYTGEVLVAVEGVTTIRYAATDNLGHTSTPKSATVRLDDSAPVSSHTAPAGWAKGPVSVTLDSGDALSGVSGIRYALDGSTESTYTGPISVAGEGTHTITYASTDLVGNAETARTATVRIDDTAPVTTVTTIADTYAATATATLVPVDALSGVAATAWRIDGGDWTSGTAVVLPYAPGRHTLQWKSTDHLDNTEAVNSASYEMLARFDDADPRVVYMGTWSPNSNTSRYAGAWKTATGATQKAYVTFTGTRFELIGSTGPAYGIARVTIDGETPGYGDLYSSAYKHLQKVYSKSGLTNAQHTAVVEWTGTKNASSTGTGIGIDAVDVAGTLDGDTIAPATSDDVAGSWRSTSATVTLSATDAHSYVRNTFYRVGGGTLTTYTAPFPVSAEGTTTVEYFSVDGAGNTETARTAEVRIDTTAPAVSDDADSAWAKGPARVHLSVSDGGSGVGSVLYSTDGTEPYLAYTGEVLVAVEGVTTIRYAATDNLGHTSTPKSATVRLDDSAPVSSHTAPAGWAKGPVSVTLDSGDALSGVSGIRYALDGSTESTYTGPISVAGEGTAHDHLRVHRPRRQRRDRQDGHGAHRRHGTGHDRDDDRRHLRSDRHGHTRTRRCPLGRRGDRVAHRRWGLDERHGSRAALRPGPPHPAVEEHRPPGQHRGGQQREL